MGHHEYRPLADMLVEMAERYGKPLFISETGAEGSGRPAWLHYVCDEVRDAQARGTDVQGICLYPVTAYPGWDNSRHCQVGLLSPVGSDGKRHVYEPLRGRAAAATSDLRLRAERCLHARTESERRTLNAFRRPRTSLRCPHSAAYLRTSAS